MTDQSVNASDKLHYAEKQIDNSRILRTFGCPHGSVLRSDEDEWANSSDDEKVSDYRRGFHNYLTATFDFQGYEMYPYNIPFTDRQGIERIYQPFARLYRYRDGIMPKDAKDVLIDIRSDEEIRLGWLIPARRAARSFAAGRNLEFTIFRDKFFSSAYYLNHIKLKKYLRCEPREDDWNIICRTVRNRPGITVKDLLAACANDESHRWRLSNTVGMLMIRGLITSDWNRHFNLYSKLYDNS